MKDIDYEIIIIPFHCELQYMQKKKDKTLGNIDFHFYSTDTRK